jgi:SAM-dependent methyltransferase
MFPFTHLPLFQMTTTAHILFTKHWETYQHVIVGNYMRHRDFAVMSLAAIREKASQGALRVLDPGCGDAMLIASQLKGLPVDSYKGFDLSSHALELALSNLDGVAGTVHLREGRMEDLIGEESGTFNFIYSSYAIHHLSDPQKKEFLKGLYAHLEPGGIFFLIDIFRLRGQDRDDYVEGYIGMIQERWNDLRQEEKQRIFDHIREYDFPATVDEMAGWGAEAGFSVAPCPIIDDRHYALIMNKL